MKMRLRVFEGMILLRLGYGETVPNWPRGLGKPIRFAAALQARAQLDVDRNLPDAGYTMFGDPVVQVDPGECELRFMSFFDWDQLAPRDYHWLQVLIERFDERPELVGHLALVEFNKCSIWLAEDACNDV
jgi:hypothetical protein